MKKKIYLAGSLFTKYEMEARIREAKIFAKTFPEYEVFAPVNQPFNGGNSTNATIFNNDANAIHTSSIFLFDLNNKVDSGTFVELGMAIELKRQNPQIKIYAFIWDFRMLKTTKSKDPYAKPWGVNGFMIGGVQKYGKLLGTFEECIEEMKKDGI